jgi:hypothetical protein
MRYNSNSITNEALDMKVQGILKVRVSMLPKLTKE